MDLLLSMKAQQAYHFAASLCPASGVHSRNHRMWVRFQSALTLFICSDTTFHRLGTTGYSSDCKVFVATTPQLAASMTFSIRKADYVVRPAKFDFHRGRFPAVDRLPPHSAN
ncbi:hypothetical protein, partial [Caballeronia arvi]|uniref:hypothetical protein n=1 Tax=Caballeronia arvi TaxID=1777135 RepID=UPI001F47D32F